MRVVLDTNVFLSAVLFAGPVAELAQWWQMRKILPLLSRPIIDEYLRTLAYKKFQLNLAEIRQILEEELVYFSEIVAVTHRTKIVHADPSDNMFLECAVSGKADVIVSGDKHLLALAGYQNIPILPVIRFLVKYR